MTTPIFTDKQNNNKACPMSPDEARRVYEMFWEFSNHLFGDMTMVRPTGNRVDQLSVIAFPFYPDMADAVLGELERMLQTENCLVAGEGSHKHYLVGHKRKDYHVVLDLLRDREEFEESRAKSEYPAIVGVMMGQLARSLGYRLGGVLELCATGRDGDPQLIPLTEDHGHMFALLDVPKTYVPSPEGIAAYITGSSRFDVEAWNAAGDLAKIKDLVNNPLFKKAMDLVTASDKRAEGAATVLDLSAEGVDVRTALAREIGIIGEGVVEAVEKAAAAVPKRKRLISGKMLMRMGYKPGKLMGEILDAVSKNFGEESNIQAIRAWVQTHYPLGGKKGGKQKQTPKQEKAAKDPVDAAVDLSVEDETLRGNLLAMADSMAEDQFCLFDYGVGQEKVRLEGSQILEAARRVRAWEDLTKQPAPEQGSEEEEAE